MYKHLICNMICYLEPAISDFRNAKNYIIFATLKVKTIFFYAFISLSSNYKSRMTFVCTCKFVQNKHIQRKLKFSNKCAVLNIILSTYCPA